MLGSCLCTLVVMLHCVLSGDCNGEKRRGLSHAPSNVLQRARIGARMQQNLVCKPVASAMEISEICRFDLKHAHFWSGNQSLVCPDRLPHPIWQRSFSSVPLASFKLHLPVSPTRSILMYINSFCSHLTLLFLRPGVMA